MLGSIISLDHWCIKKSGLNLSIIGLLIGVRKWPSKALRRIFRLLPSCMGDLNFRRKRSQLKLSPGERVRVTLTPCE